MKKVLYFSPTGNIGGAERNLLLMCRKMPQNGYEPIVVLPNEGVLPPIFAKEKIKTIFFAKNFLEKGDFLSIIWATFLLWLKIRKEKVDIIHANSIFAMYLPIFYGAIFKIPVILHCADFDPKKGDIQFINFFAKNTTVIAVSEAIKNTLIEKNLKKEIITIIYNGYEPPLQIKNTRAEFIKKWGIGENDFLLGITGRIDAWKGQKWGILALAKLKDLPIKLFILGDFHLIKNGCKK
jgi:glycosyltransferase involved in cell wall biosynthesis